MALISHVLDPATPALPDDRLRDAEDFVFRALRMPNGTYKTTSWGRLTALDELAASCVDPARPLTVLDVGVSSGVTTADLVRVLRKRASSVEATAVDLFLDAEVVTYPFGVELLVHKATRRVIEAALGPISIVDDQLTPSRPLSYLRASTVRLLTGVMRGAQALGIGGTRRDMPLVSRKASALVSSMVEWDVFAFRPEWEAQFGLVRAANILNHVYFPEARLRLALGHLKRYMAPGAVMVLARCIDLEIHASILREQQGTLVVEHRVGNGSEVEAIAVSL